MKKIFAFFSCYSKTLLGVFLGVFLVAIGTTAATSGLSGINPFIPVPPQMETGDILTADDMNKIINGVSSLDTRTQELKTDSASGNVSVGKPSDGSTPKEKLDIQGAVKVGNTTNTNTGAIRYTGSDFEGYTTEGWKSLTKGSGGEGGTCEAVVGAIDFTTEIAEASCTKGAISYSAVEWKTKQGKLFPSFAVQVNANVNSASVNCLGNACRLHLICCSGGAGGGGDDDVLSKLACGDGEVPKWNNRDRKWICGQATDSWTVFEENVYRSTGNVGIGNTNPTQKLEVSGQVKATGFCLGNVCKTSWDSVALNLPTCGANEVLKSNGTSFICVIDQKGSTAAGNSGEIQFNNAGNFGSNADFFWDDTNKRLGIGTKTPITKLQVTPGSIMLGTNKTGENHHITHESSGSFVIWDGLYGEGVSRFVINATGNVGIGTMMPMEKFDVQGKIKSFSTQSTDGPTIVATKDYVDSKVSSGDSLWTKNQNPVTKSGGWFFDKKQEFPSISGIKRFQYFTQDGKKLLAIAHATGVSLYQWNGTAFVLSQTVNSVPDARDVKIFSIGNKTYLGTVHYAASGFFYVYEWNGSFFTEKTVLPVENAYNASVISIGQDVYVGISNVGVNSKVYKWNGTTFVLYQGLPSTANAYAIDSAVVNNNFYFFVANANIVKTYKWDGASEFTLSQEIVGSAPRDLEHFTIGNQFYLGVLNTSANAQIFAFNGSGFSEVQNFTTNTADSMKFFTMNNANYLALVNKSGNESYLYKHNGVNFDHFYTFSTDQGDAVEFASFDNLNHLFLSAKDFSGVYAFGNFPSTSEEAIFYNSGIVGIGTSTPTEKLEVAGNLKATAFLYSSDRRWKKNILPLSSALEKISELNGVSFEWKQENFPEKNFPQGKQIGFIAQDVENVVPELVHTDTLGYKSVEYGNMTALLVEAVKELKTENELLKKRIEVLEQSR